MLALLIACSRSGPAPPSAPDPQEAPIQEAEAAKGCAGARNTCPPYAPYRWEECPLGKDAKPCPL